MNIRSCLLVGLCLTSQAFARSNQDPDHRVQWDTLGRSMGVSSTNLPQFRAIVENEVSTRAVLKKKLDDGSISTQQFVLGFQETARKLLKETKAIADPALFAKYQLQAFPNYAFFRTQAEHILGLTPKQLAD